MYGMRIELRIAGLFRLCRLCWRPQLFPIAPHITGAFHRMSAESKDAMKVYTDEQADKGGRDPALFASDVTSQPLPCRPLYPSSR